MKNPFAPLFVLIFAAACGAPQQPAPQQPATEAQPQFGALQVGQPWAAPMPSGVDVAAGYLVIDNQSASDDRLLTATSPRAARVEIHEMTMDGAVMRMRQIDGLAIPAGQSVSLAPGGLHLMFFGVTDPFAEGQEVPVELIFEHAGAMSVMLPVRRDGEAHTAH